ncbi:MAG: zinc-dependent alcohol dehydrogenase [Oscillospiraceae bacterium]|jgi:2-desacetyl-2-hydroxyethyl bacteriochlorophyllide A dehydrogenase
MKVRNFYGKGDLRLEEKPVPKAGPGQLVVKIKYCGICGTDLEFYRTGALPPFVQLPMILGHENIGVVTEVGEGVADFKVGDMLLCGPPSRCEQLCPSCRKDMTNICINGFPNTAGIGGPDGGYAEYMLVRDAAHTMLIKTPENVDPKDAVLFDVICVSLHGIRRSNFKFGDNVVVSGTGPIGLSAIQFLKAGGANKIIVLGTSDEKEPIVMQYGADYYFNSKKCADIGGEIKKILGSPVGADVVFECAGKMASLSNCIYQCVKPGGQVLVIGTIQEPMNIVPSTFSILEPDINFSFVYTEEDVNIYLEMLAAGKISFPNMVTDIVSLDDCMEKFFDKPDRTGMLKVLIDPSL